MAPTLSPSLPRANYLSTTASPRRTAPTFPTNQVRTSSTLSSTSTTPGAWGTPSPTLNSSPTDLVSGGVRRTTRPSLSLLQSEKKSIETIEGHPLKSDWEVYFSNRITSSNQSGGKKIEKSNGHNLISGTVTEDWSTSVVKLGGFSSIESLHPFMAHLTPPSLLPASLPAHPSQISDLNIFRSSIQPVWEDPANVGGGRFVIRLRKGVADRVWEEIVWALVGERIGEGGEGGKVVGGVLSVRKDEDILSIWCRVCSRNERDLIRESIRLALSPLLTPLATSSLSLDFKPHPSSPSHAISLPQLSSPTSVTPSTPARAERSGRSFGTYSNSRVNASSVLNGTETHGTPYGGAREEGYTRGESQSRRDAGIERGEKKERGSSTGWGPN